MHYVKLCFVESVLMPKSSPCDLTTSVFSKILPWQKSPVSVERLRTHNVFLCIILLRDFVSFQVASDIKAVVSMSLSKGLHFRISSYAVSKNKNFTQLPFKVSIWHRLKTVTYWYSNFKERKPDSSKWMSIYTLEHLPYYVLWWFLLC